MGAQLRGVGQRGGCAEIDAPDVLDAQLAQAIDHARAQARLVDEDSGARAKRSRFRSDAEADSLQPDWPNVGLLKVLQRHVLVFIRLGPLPCHETQRTEVADVFLVVAGVIDRLVE